MSIFSDFNDLKEEWKTQSIVVKTIAILSFFFTISSLSSLSETIFQWKGFILDGIEFYHKYISSPIREVFRFIGIRLSKSTIDVLISFNLFAIPIIRYFLKSLRKDEEAKSFGEKAALGSISLILFFYLIVIVLILFLTSDKVITSLPWITNYYTILYLIFGVVLITLELFNKRNKSVFLRIYTPVILGIFVILVLAAVNSGLIR